MSRKGRGGDGPSGVMVIDKAKGMSSFDVIRRLRRITGERKQGHAGTLDPMATGVLMIMFNKSTRLSSVLMDSAKCYRAKVVFGAATDTDDADGKIVAEGEVGHLTDEAVEEALARFVGEIEQAPPQYSALHVDGKRAYELAREGVEVKLASRIVVVDRIDDVTHTLTEGARLVSFDVWCGKGTYIRSIARDLGEALGTRAHLGGLRRTFAARFGVEESVTLEALEALEEGAWREKLLSPYDAARSLKTLILSDDEARRLASGQGVGRLMSLTPGVYRVPIPATKRLLAIVMVGEDGQKPKTRVFESGWTPTTEV